MQSSWGNQSPVIEAGGNVSVTYGLDEERVKAMLMEQQEHLFRKMRDSGFAADDRERRLLEQQLQEVSAKLADIERSYNEELARRKAADDVLAQLRGQLPEAQIEQAQASLRQGDTAAARQVFHAVADKAGAAVALAAFQLGQMAEGDLEYAEALRQYKKAAALEEDTPEYLLAAGKMARKLAEYRQAQDWLEHLLEIREAEGESAELGGVLHELALLRKELGQYKEAEPLHLRAVALKEKFLGAEHPDVAEALNDLGLFYKKQDQLSKAESLYLRSLKIREKYFGAEHLDAAESENNLAALYRMQERYNDAEKLYLVSLAIREKILGKKHPDVAQSLGNLALLYRETERYDESEQAQLRSLAIKEHFFGKEHPDIALSLNNLAFLYKQQERYVEAEPLLQRALEVREKKLGGDHQEVSITLRIMAKLYRDQGRYAEAEPLFQRALAIMKEKLPAGHSRISGCQKEYDEMKEKMGEQAE